MLVLPCLLGSTLSVQFHVTIRVYYDDLVYFLSMVADQSISNARGLDHFQIEISLAMILHL